MSDRHVRAMEQALSIDDGCFHCVEQAITALVITLPHHDWATSLRRAYQTERFGRGDLDDYLAIVDKVTHLEVSIP